MWIEDGLASFTALNSGLFPGIDVHRYRGKRQSQFLTHIAIICEEKSPAFHASPTDIFTISRAQKGEAREFDTIVSPTPLEMRRCIYGKRKNTLHGHISALERCVVSNVPCTFTRHEFAGNLCVSRSVLLLSFTIV